MILFMAKGDGGGAYDSDLFSFVMIPSFKETGPSSIYAFASFESADSLSSVPLPAALYLFAPALAGLGYISRRRKPLKAA